MKRRFVTAAVLTLLVLTAGWTVASSFPSPADSKTVKLKVLKVYSAKDGDALYRSYVVNWKNQEVIVRDTLVKTSYQVGDVAPVVVMSHPYPYNKERHGLLNFEIGKMAEAVDD